MDESKNQTERGVTLRITDLNLKYLNLSCQYNAAQNKHMDGSMCQKFILTTQVGKSVLFMYLYTNAQYLPTLETWFLMLESIRAPDSKYFQ